MRQIHDKLSCSRLLVLVWVSLWMLMVPLFHVHPEADHHHGDASHVHGGTVHTVFSPDLECEYAEIVHDPTCPEAEHQHLQARAHPGHAVNHPEIEFSLLTVPVDRPLPKPGIAVAELPVVELRRLNEPWSWLRCIPARHNHSVSLHHTPSACSSLPIPLIHFLVS